VKIIIAGGGDSGEQLAQALIKEKREVVLIESDRSRAEELAEKLDCLVINGNAAHPSTLEEAGIREADIVFALTGNDRDNVIIALIAKSMGVKKVIVKLEDPGYNELLLYMGISDIINPSRLIVVQSLSILRGFDLINISTMIRTNIRLHFLVVNEKIAGKKLGELSYDKDKARPLLVYHGADALFPDNNMVLEKGDTVLFAIKADYYEKFIEEFVS